MWEEQSHILREEQCIFYGVICQKKKIKNIHISNAVKEIMTK